MGLKVFFTTNAVSFIKREEKYWSPKKSILTDWTKQIYIRKIGPKDIRIRQTIDSAMWKETIVKNDLIFSSNSALTIEENIVTQNNSFHTDSA